MKLWKPMLAMLLCSGLIITLGLTACGDDDDEEGGMSCEQALSTLTSSTCGDAVLAAAPGVQSCLDGCAPGDEVCVDDCFDAITLPSSCEQAIAVLLDSETAVCGSCYVNCGQGFVDCVVQGGQAEACLTTLGVCSSGCNLPG